MTTRPGHTATRRLRATALPPRNQGSIPRGFRPAETAVVTVGRLQAGTKDNIIPDTAELGINIRTYSRPTRDLVRAAVERVITGEAAPSGAPRPPQITWINSAPLLISDPAATPATMAALREHFG